ncbi:hypothetical protein PSTT_13837 [Puccinia striiformis]|uniref:Uncharacterized protein n=1 Tax=Puccinia striiformis TaxID=27350 RepID=A0A2S4UQ48_9BASI|nr:hypothetical protein PSTT_13837 [Puccinia striiformis]
MPLPGYYQNCLKLKSTSKIISAEICQTFSLSARSKRRRAGRKRAGELAPKLEAIKPQHDRTPLNQTAKTLAHRIVDPKDAVIRKLANRITDALVADISNVGTNEDQAGIKLIPPTIISLLSHLPTTVETFLSQSLSLSSQLPTETGPVTALSSVKSFKILNSGTVFPMIAKYNRLQIDPNRKTNFTWPNCLMGTYTLARQFMAQFCQEIKSSESATKLKQLAKKIQVTLQENIAQLLTVDIRYYKGAFVSTIIDGFPVHQEFGTRSRSDDKFIPGQDDDMLPGRGN